MINLNKHRVMINLKVIISIIVSSVVFRMSPTAAQLPGCPAAWEAGTTYAAGDMVSDDRTIFKCTTYPTSLFCSQDAYKPISSTSAGAAYTLAWETVGLCLGTIAPTVAVVKPGCPNDWVVGTVLSVLLNFNTITNKEDSINKEVVSPITHEEESRNNNYKPISTTIEVAIVCSTEIVRNPIELQWLLAPMIVGYYAIAVAEEADDHTTYSCVGELKTLALCKEEEVRR
jgi:hypothetical protein